MAGPKRRLSRSSERVLGALYDSAPKPMYGMELMDAARAPSGTLYPILARFRDYDWLTAEREDIDPSKAGRPARTYYKLTANGFAEARNHAQVPTTAGALAWDGGRI